MKKSFLLSIFVFMGLSLGLCGFAEDLPGPGVELLPSDRILILAPHPDDEVIGCAGIIQKAKAKGLPIRIVFFTYGDNNQWSFAVYRKHLVFMPRAVRKMGLMRHDEAIAASHVLGLSKEHLTFLGYPDFGTLNIWYHHWGNQPALTSMLTKVKAVPYSTALRPGASYKGEEILKDLKTVLLEFQPTKIFLSHPADHNGDHRSLYLFTRIALWDLGKKIQAEVFPYLVHFKYWPKPAGFFPQKSLEPPAFFKEEISWKINQLTPHEIQLKYQAIRAHQSQYHSSAKYLASFVRANELYGDFSTFALQPGLSGAPLTPEFTKGTVEMPQELTDRERAAFVGIEERHVKLENGNFVLSIKFSRPLAEGVELSAFIFGYRQDIPFGQMPKLHIKLGAFRSVVLDQNRRIFSKDIAIVRQPKQIIISVPLKILKNPERILTSTNSYLAEVPLDWVSWQILQLPKVGSL